MTSTQLTSTVDRRPSALAARSIGTLHRLWRGYWNWRARQATVEILRSLDDRTLKDIGMNRLEIESFVHGTPGERMRAYDAAWLWRSGA
jgi:uncharacterized protein YjiS (DUF1127 family)